MSDKIEVHAFKSRSDYSAMIDYFLGAEDLLLLRMGVDRARLPTRESWLRSTLLDHERPDREKERFYMAWCFEDELVGHSSISHIVHGSTAHCHLHLWHPKLRRRGLGSEFLAKSVDVYFKRFALQVLASEPKADNEAPNSTLAKLGFRATKCYRTSPTDLALEQKVRRHELQRDEWIARRQDPMPLT